MARDLSDNDVIEVAPPMARPPANQRPKERALAVRDPISDCAVAVIEFHRKAKVAENKTRELMAEAVQNAYQAGLALIKMKGLVKHGDWAGTLEKKCPGISQRTAARYMKLATDYRDHPDQLPVRPLGELYASTSAHGDATLVEKGPAPSSTKGRKRVGLHREIDGLRAFLKSDNRGTFVAEMSSNERAEFISLLREFIEILGGDNN